MTAASVWLAVGMGVVGFGLPLAALVLTRLLSGGGGESRPDSVPPAHGHDRRAS